MTKRTKQNIIIVTIISFTLGAICDEYQQEIDPYYAEIMYGLNPNEYPITHGNLKTDTGTTSLNNYTAPSIIQTSKLKITITPILPATLITNQQTIVPEAQIAKSVKPFSIEPFIIEPATIMINIEFDIPEIATKIAPITPLEIFWQNIVMADKISPIEKILISIQNAANLQTTISIILDPNEQVKPCDSTSVSINTIQAAKFIDTLTLAIYAEPEIKISDIPIKIYTETMPIEQEQIGIELYNYTVQKIQEGAPLIEIYNEMVTAVGEQSPISLFWKTQIFNSMSGVINTFAANQISPYNIEYPKQLPINQLFITNSITINPVHPSKTNQPIIMTQYDLYELCAEWGSPISELAKLINTKKKQGLDTTKEEAKFNRILRLEMEYYQRLNNTK